MRKFSMWKLLVACLLWLACLWVQAGVFNEGASVAARPHIHKHVKEENGAQAAASTSGAIQLDNTPDQKGEGDSGPANIPLALAGIGGFISLCMFLGSLKQKKAPKGRFGPETSNQNPATWLVATVICFGAIYVIPKFYKPPVPKPKEPMNLVAYKSDAFGFTLKFPEKGIGIKRDPVPNTQNVATNLEYTEPDGAFHFLYMSLPSQNDLRAYLEKKQSPFGGKTPLPSNAVVYYDVNKGLEAMADRSTKENMSSVTSKVDITYKENPGKYIEGTRDSMGGIVKERIIIAQNCIYDEAVLGTPDFVNSAQSQEFMDSLDFTGGH